MSDQTFAETLAEDDTEEELLSRFEGGEERGEKAYEMSVSSSNLAGAAARGITRAREILEREDDTVRPLKLSFATTLIIHPRPFIDFT